MRSQLTDKQSKFISEYLIDLNATQAAIRAGYSQKTAAETGYENLRKPQIQKAIQKQQAESAARNKTTVDTIDQMHKRAFDVAEENGQASAMTQAANNLAKLHGLIVDKKEIDQNLYGGMALIAPDEFESNEEWEQHYNQ